VSDVEQIKAGLLKIIEDVESHGSAATAISNAYQQAVATFNSLTSGSQNPEVKQAGEVIAAAAQYVFYAEGKSEEVRYAIEGVVRGL
jgi:predicted nuclease with RNAse H fold